MNEDYSVGKSKGIRKNSLHLHGHAMRGFFADSDSTSSICLPFPTVSCLPACQYLCMGSRSLPSINLPTCRLKQGYYLAQCWCDCFCIAKWFYLLDFQSISLWEKRAWQTESKLTSLAEKIYLWFLNIHCLPLVFFWTLGIITNTFFQYTYFFIVDI